MTSRWSGISTVVVVAAVSVCGLFMLGGVAPTATIPLADGATTDDTIGDTTSVPVLTTSPTTTEPTPVATTIETATTSTTTTNTTTTTTPPTTPTTTTTPTPTTTTTPTTTPTTTALVPAPPTVTASSTIVGVGGTVTFRGSCDDTNDLVVVSVTREADGSSEVVDTGLTASPWTYTWSAPTVERDASSFVFRFWCDPPGDDTGAAPTDHQVRIDMVASAAPPPAPVLPAPSDQGLPETN